MPIRFRSSGKWNAINSLTDYAWPFSSAHLDGRKSTEESVSVTSRQHTVGDSGVKEQIALTEFHGERK